MMNMKSQMSKTGAVKDVNLNLFSCQMETLNASKGQPTHRHDLCDLAQTLQNIW
jgi:hypothetical protein